MMSIEAFDKWLDHSVKGDKIVYYTGDLGFDSTQTTVNPIQKLRNHVMNYCAKWVVDAQSCSLDMVNIIDLFQKKIKKMEHKDDVPIFEYIAVRK